MIYFFSVTMHMEDVIPLEATGLLFVILKSLFSLFLTWNHSQIQFGVSCQNLMESSFLEIIKNSWKRL